MITFSRKAGSVDVFAIIRIIDSTDGTPELGVVFNTSGIDIQYRRELAASVAITEVTLAALTTAHTDGGFLHIGNGYYRVDLPDAAVATGASGVLVHGVVTGMVVIGCYIDLVAYDPVDGVRLGLTALPNAAAAAAGGVPVIGTGTNTFKSDGSANVTFANTSIATVTTLTNLPAITTNWLTAAGIAAAALNGKGDWNIGKTGYALSSAGVQAIWDAATSALTVVGSIGKLLVDKMAFLTGDAFVRLGAPAGASVSADIAAIEAQTDDIGAAGAGLTALGDTRIANLDAAVSSRLATAGYTVPPTVGAVADQVWDEVLSGHLTAGTTGAALNGAGSAGDPWGTALPGAYGAGTAGKILGDNLNAAITSRSSHSAADVWTSGTRTLTAFGFTVNCNDSAGVTTLLSRIASAITITAGKVDVNDKTGFALTSGERDSIASAMLVLGNGIETGVTLKQALRAILAFVSGTSAGAATSSIIFHAPDGTTARITMTVDPLTGERSVMVLNL